MVHGRIVDLKNLCIVILNHSIIFRGQLVFFCNTPKYAYKPLIRMIYAHFQIVQLGELETLIMGEMIFIDYTMFDINFSGFSTFSKNPYPSNSNVSFEQDKQAIALDNSYSLPSILSPKFLSFEIHMITHIVSTTLLPFICSLSTLSQLDTLLTYYLITRHKVNISSFIINHMIEATFDPSSLPCGLIITRILEASYFS